MPAASDVVDETVMFWAKQLLRSDITAGKDEAAAGARDESYTTS